MSKRTAEPKSFPQQIADASLAIARANHYLVGFETATWAQQMSFDDCHEAMQLLITRENAATERSHAKRHCGLAIEVLASYVMRVHHCQA